MSASRGQSFRRGAARVVFAACLALAALAPFVANELPLCVRGAAGTSFPAFAGATGTDIAWIAGCLVVVAVAAVRGRARVVALLTVAVATTTWALVAEPPAAVAVRTAVELTRPDVAVVRTVIRSGETSTNLDARLSPIGGGDHPLGTDDLGRDVAARLLFGLRISLLIAVGTTVLASLLGLIVGGLAALGGRVLDGVATWTIDAISSVPAVVMIVVVQAAGITGLSGMVLLLALWRAGFIARLVRQEVMDLRSAAFVTAAQAMGEGRIGILVRHILPHAFAPVVVAAGFGIGATILAESSLSFLGMGVPEPAASLGGLLADGRRNGPDAVHLVVVPGVILLALIASAQVIASAARDALDPRGAAASR